MANGGAIFDGLEGRWADIRGMNEDYLQYVWRCQRLPHGSLKCTSGRELAVLFQGHWNRHSGPDFLEARLRIGRELWVGSVEIHIRASDWRRHRHSGDPAYNNVVLHVVYEDDEPLVNDAGQEVPTLVLKDLLDEQHWKSYCAFIETPKHIACSAGLSEVSKTARTIWLQRMGIERLDEKSVRVEQLHHQHRGDWNAVWWQMLCRSFGFGLNRIAYERLAGTLPWQALGRIANKPFQLEALFALHSGWFELDARLRTHSSLAEEYNHLCTLLGLQPAHPAVWHRGRMKPHNHPRVRLGQLAALVHRGSARWSSIANAESLESLRALFEVQMPTSALNLKSEPGISERMGRRSVDALLANAALPMLFYRSRHFGTPEQTEQVLDWFEALPAEDNRFTRMWSEVGWPAENLLDSQGHLHLFHSYCSRKKCLSCSIGVTLLNNA